MPPAPNGDRISYGPRRTPADSGMRPRLNESYAVDGPSTLGDLLDGRAPRSATRPGSERSIVRSCTASRFTALAAAVPGGTRAGRDDSTGSRVSTLGWSPTAAYSHPLASSER